MTTTVLVTGGAGYIGSHMIWGLLETDHRVIALDNLSTGVRDLVAKASIFVEGDVRDRDLIARLIDTYRIDAVLHFAGSVAVPESVRDPLFYFDNNVGGSRDLIEACVKRGVPKFLFSSTAAVYGNANGKPVSEEHPKEPINPYGRSKLMTEWMLHDTACAHDFRYIVLRYFNVAGADPLGRTGQSTPGATHLLKLACQAALGSGRELEVFGTDYPTHDGTGVRDYIHVTDLISAHLLALEHLSSAPGSSVYNVGYGRGFSVLEVIAAVERVSGKAVPFRKVGRRTGDPSTLIANSERIRQSLGWQPKYDDLDLIVAHAYDWERRLRPYVGGNQNSGQTR